MSGELKGKRIAIVATDGFEQSELLKPQEALKAAGAVVEVIAPKTGSIQGMEHHTKGKKVSAQPRPFRRFDGSRGGERRVRD